MAFDRWLVYREAGVDAEQDDVRERYIEQAFAAWLQGAGGERQTFPQLLESLGLRERQPKTRSARATLIDAERIRAADRRSREH